MSGGGNSLFLFGEGSVPLGGNGKDCFVVSGLGSVLGSGKKVGFFLWLFFHLLCLRNGKPWLFVVKLDMDGGMGSRFGEVHN